MKIIQSISVDTTKLGNGIEPIMEDIAALKAYLRANPSELYATPQLVAAEKPLAIVVLRLKRKKTETLLTMINPMLLATRNIVASEETQAGIEGTWLNFRHTELQVAYNALPRCVPTEVTLTGKSALVFQQAFRLTQGITIDAFGLRIDNYVEYQQADETGKQDIFRQYVQALREVQQEMTQDSEVAEYIKAVQFIAEKAQGSIKEELSQPLRDAREEVVSATKKILSEQKDKKAT